MKCPYDKSGFDCSLLNLHFNSPEVFSDPCTFCDQKRLYELKHKIIKQNTEDKPMNEYKIVTVKHPNCNTPYTFSVPKTLDLNVGDYVLCDTKTHNYPQVAQCITPSFVVSEDILKGPLNIAPTKLRPIVAHLIAEWYKEPEENDNDRD